MGKLKGAEIEISPVCCSSAAPVTHLVGAKVETKDSEKVLGCLCVAIPEGWACCAWECLVWVDCPSLCVSLAPPLGQWFPDLEWQLG